MDFEEELDGGHRLLLIGAVAGQFVGMYLRTGLMIALGWAASLICSVLFLKRFFSARRQAGGSMTLPVYMTFALGCWMLWPEILSLGRGVLGDWFSYVPFFGSLGLVLVGGFFVFREGEVHPGADVGGTENRHDLQDEQDGDIERGRRGRGARTHFPALTPSCVRTTDPNAMDHDLGPEGRRGV